MATHAPPAGPGPRDLDAEAEVAAVQEVVTALRAYRSSRGLPPRAPLVMAPPPHPATGALDAVTAAPDELAAGLTAVLLADGRSIAVGPAQERIDPAAERSRLADELSKAQAELARAEAQARQPGLRRARARPPGGRRARQGRALRHRARRARRAHRRTRLLSPP